KFLFDETAGCFLVEVENEKVAKKLFGKAAYSVIGKTTPLKSLTTLTSQKILFKADLEVLKKTWQEPMKKYF
ncbi:MAG TPA: hypothetical protein VLF68_04525, partial [Candidatus Saccharimonadales bacterium]|nr:hypothetical protein [Candidatus Saccharimonadales bacterium]